jgi:hypothetical protein
MARFTALVRQLLAGLGATWVKAPGFEAPPARHFRVALDPAPGATPRQLGDLAWERLAVPLASRPGDWALQPDAQGNITFKLHTFTSETEVRINRGSRQAEVSQRPLTFLETAVSLHAARIKPAADTFLPVAMWSWYVELSVWSLWVFLLSGLYLWLAVKPWRPLAVWSFVSGWALCAASVLWMW